MDELRGYRPDFLGKNLRIPLPTFSERLREDLAPVEGSKKKELRYVHFSVFLSRSRKFPVLTATNIDGSLFKPIDRSKIFAGGRDRWRLDDRARPYQWGDVLYSVENSDFDKGHMTKREDPQWGATEDAARRAAQSTFFYSNAVPQVKELNGAVWSRLERYILSRRVVARKLRVAVFTGPVLSNEDPVFVRKVKKEEVRLPTLFWKVVYFSPDRERLHSVGFLMGQQTLLEQKGIVVAPPRLGPLSIPLGGGATFMDFEDADTYQVRIDTIELLTGLSFHDAFEPFKNRKPVKLILKQVDIPPGISAPGVIIPARAFLEDFDIEGLVLE